jgi:hypothetical protein
MLFIITKEALPKDEQPIEGAKFNKELNAWTINLSMPKLLNLAYREQGVILYASDKNSPLPKLRISHYIDSGV